MTLDVVTQDQEEQAMTNDTPDPLSDLRSRATVTVPEAAALLGVSRETAYRWAREGTLPGVLRLGPTLVRIRTAELIALLDSA